MNNWAALDRARIRAATSNNPKWQMACLLYSISGDTVGSGVNSASFADGPPWTEHAEEAAIISMAPIAKPHCAYVARVNKQGQGRLARPCENCATQLRMAGVREVYWTGVNGELCSGVL